MTEGMTLERFYDKYPIHRRVVSKSFSHEYRYELTVSEAISFSEEAALTPDLKRSRLKCIAGRLIFELETLIKKAREDFERIE
jgi:hypothetical protein